ncbi:MAG: hypothetical protein ACFFF4_00500 [Candidatus Thorarchaeota archaeon]
MKDKLFLIGSFLVLVAGAFLLFRGITASSDSPMFGIMGFLLIIGGVIFLITGYITPSVAQSKEGVILAYIMIFASIIAIIGSFDISALWPLTLGGAGLIGVTFLAWPCFCCQGSQKNRAKIIGVASAHDSITLHEISQRTGLSVEVVRDTIYDALGKGELVGKMEGPTFIRGRPTTTTHTDTTREREVVKVLVICPYCGAKTEQGLSKCQNCGADL